MGAVGVIGARQIRAARALLDWSQDDLADKAELSIATIRKLELGQISPRPATTKMIRYVIENAGVEFIESEGVRRRPEELASYQGVTGFAAFFEDMGRTVMRLGGEVILFAAQEADCLHQHRSEIEGGLQGLLRQSEDIYVKYLTTPFGAFPEASARLEIRLLERLDIKPMPFAVYGDKFAMILFDEGEEARILVVRSPCAVAAGRQLFFSIWNKNGALAPAHNAGASGVSALA